MPVEHAHRQAQLSDFAIFYEVNYDRVKNLISGQFPETQLQVWKSDLGGNFSVLVPLGDFPPVSKVSWWQLQGILPKTGWILGRNPCTFTAHLKSWIEKTQKCRFFPAKECGHLSELLGEFFPVKQKTGLLVLEPHQGLRSGQAGNLWCIACFPFSCCHDETCNWCRTETKRSNDICLESSMNITSSWHFKKDPVHTLLWRPDTWSCPRKSGMEPSRSSGSTRDRGQSSKLCWVGTSVLNLPSPVDRPNGQRPKSFAWAKSSAHENWLLWVKSTAPI